MTSNSSFIDNTQLPRTPIAYINPLKSNSFNEKWMWNKVFLPWRVRDAFWSAYFTITAFNIFNKTPVPTGKKTKNLKRNSDTL